MTPSKMAGPPSQVINNQPLIFFVTFSLIFTRNDWPTVSSEARHCNSMFRYPNTVKFAKTWIFNQACSWWQKIRWKPVSCLIYMYYPDFNPKADQTQNSTIFLTFTLFWHWKIMKNIYCNLKVLYYYLLHANLYLNGQTSFIPPPTQKLKTPLTPSLTMGVKGLISSKKVTQCISHGVWPVGITAGLSLLCHLLCLHKPALSGLGDGSGRGKGNGNST